MTVAITFSPGTYGTYLEWCLTTLTSDIPIVSPFRTNGSSHNFKGVHLNNFNGWHKFLASNQQDPFARFHPKTQADYNLSNNLDYVCNTAESVVYLYPDHKSILLCINNRMSKIWSDWWAREMSSNINPNKIYQNWPVESGTPPDQIPVWIQREFLSYHLMPAWFDEVEWYHLDTWSNPKACIVTVNALLFDFESTMEAIRKHCGLTYVKQISDLLPFHEENLKLQEHLCQDQVCNNIVDSVISGTEFEWDPLPAGSEIWVQWELRNRGYEIQCHGLDIFPTTSVQLKKLIYKSNNDQSI